MVNSKRSSLSWASPLLIGMRASLPRVVAQGWFAVGAGAWWLAAEVRSWVTPACRRLVTVCGWVVAGGSRAVEGRGSITAGRAGELAAVVGLGDLRGQRAELGLETACGVGSGQAAQVHYGSAVRPGH